MSPKDLSDRLSALVKAKWQQVYSVVAGYLVTAPIVLQVAALWLQTFEAPAWVMKVLFVLFAAGFLGAVGFGLSSDPPPEGHVKLPPGFPKTPSWRNYWIGILVLALIACALTWFVNRPKFNSIAVLPFEILGEDKENFGPGIQDDLLTNLAQITNLTVISRSSVMIYGPNVPRPLPKIREELGVAHILEGTLRIQGDRVSLNVRLIDTANGKKRWAKPYSLSKGNSPNLQGELASDLAAKLRIILSPDDKARLAKKRTDNLDSWIAYQQGRELQLLPEASEEQFIAAINFYKEALDHDPKFALARAQLAFMQAQLFEMFDSTNTTLLGEARENAKQAVEADSKCAEAHLARGCCAYLDRDAELTRKELDRAVALRPNDASVRLAVGVTEQRLGWNKEALANYLHAAKLGPREAEIFVHLGHLRFDTGHEREARAALDRAATLASKSAYYRCVQAFAEISWTGNIEQAEKILAEIPPGKDPGGRVTSAKCTLALLKRDFREALRLVQAYPPEKTFPTIDSGGLGEPQTKVEAEAIIHLYDGDYARAYEYFDSVRPGYETAVANNSQNPGSHVQLAILYAWMGWKDEAKAEAARTEQELTALPRLPMHVKRSFAFALAKIYAWASEPDRAWRQIELYFDYPATGYSRYNFRLDPVWDPLRNDPRFAQRFSTP